MRKICFITGSRADYGLIRPVLEAVKKSRFKLQLVVLGSHLDVKFGATINEIKKDGIKIDAEIRMPLKADSPAEIVRAMGVELAGISAAYEKLQPDLVFITGDRYEMLAAASAALLFRIPAAHLYGGDVTEGAFDDSMRHAISKMAVLHFVSNEASRRRVIQMGESPQNVFNVGSPSLDKIKTLKKISPKGLEKALNIKFRKNNLLITFHPETLARQSLSAQMKEFLGALNALDKSHLLIFTAPNADPQGLQIRDYIEAFTATRENAVMFDSLGYQKYFSLLAEVDMVIGNSSSGLYEAPSFKIPTVNIGDRQKGRLRACSVIDTECKKISILKAIAKAKKLNCSKIKNPYSSGDASKKIVAALDKTGDFKKLIHKKFYDIHNS